MSISEWKGVISRKVQGNFYVSLLSNVWNSLLYFNCVFRCAYHAHSLQVLSQLNIFLKISKQYLPALQMVCGGVHTKSLLHQKTPCALVNVLHRGKIINVMKRTNNVVSELLICCRSRVSRFCAIAERGEAAGILLFVLLLVVLTGSRFCHCSTEKKTF